MFLWATGRPLKPIPLNRFTPSSIPRPLSFLHSCLMFRSLFADHPSRVRLRIERALSSNSRDFISRSPDYHQASIYPFVGAIHSSTDSFSCQVKDVAQGLSTLLQSGLDQCEWLLLFNFWLIKSFCSQLNAFWTSEFIHFLKRCWFPYPVVMDHCGRILLLGDILLRPSDEGLLRFNQRFEGKFIPV